MTALVTCAPTFNSTDEEVESFYVELMKFYSEDHTSHKVIIGNFNARYGLQMSPEDLYIWTHGLI